MFAALLFVVVVVVVVVGVVRAQVPCDSSQNLFFDDYEAVQRLYMAMFNSPALSPDWLTMPTTDTICSKAGIQCQKIGLFCRLVRLSMKPWTVTENDFADVHVGRLTFVDAVALDSLTLHLGGGSDGVLPGSQSGEPCPALRTLPSSLTIYLVQGDPANQPSGIRAGTGSSLNFFRNLATSVCSTSPRLIMLGISALPSVEASYSRSNIGACLEPTIFVVDRVPLATGEGVCFTFDVDTALFVQTDIRSLDSDIFCDGHSPPRVLIIDGAPRFTAVPSCLIGMCEAQEAHIAFYAFRSENLCRLGTNNNTDVEFNYADLGNPGSGKGYKFVSDIIAGDDTPQTVCELDRRGSACLGCDGYDTISPPATFDQCGVCAGTNTACADCRGVVHGTALVDFCGVCDGDESSCGGCVPDSCGVCGGGDDCRPCENDERDICGVCRGDGTRCLDCAGVPFGTSKRDDCGECNGDGSTCRDCRGEIGGPYAIDACGLCSLDLRPECLTGCDAAVGSTLEYDRCGTCGGNNECVDCTGRVGGLAVYDECGVCDGDGTECLDCRGTLNGPFRVNRCLQCVDSNDVDWRECDENEVRHEINHRVAYWILGFIGVAILICLLAFAVFSFAPDCVLGVWGLVRRRRRRRTSSSSLSDDEDAQLTRDGRGAAAAAASDRAVSTAGVKSRVGSKPGTSTVVLTVLALIAANGVHAATPVYTSAELMYIELCTNTNIRNVLPGSCASATPVSVCDETASGITLHTGYTLFECSEGRITKATMQFVNRLRGRITRNAWRTLEDAETIHFVANKDVVFSTRVPEMPDDLPLDRLEIESFVEDDDDTDGDGETFLGEFTQLRTLRLEGLATPAFTRLPRSIASADKLRVLELIDIVSLRGRLDKDNILCSLPRLRILRIRGTLLEGSAACGWSADGWASLRELDLRHNQLSGSIPSLSTLPWLNTLKLDNNILGGSVDASLFPLGLKHLSVSANVLDAIEGDWRKLTNLEVFEAANARMSGTIPILDVDGLRRFDVSYNRFSGTLPSGFANEKFDRIALFTEPGTPTASDVPYELFRVDHNLLTEDWPPFRVEHFDGDCDFSGNAVCRSLNPPVPPPQEPNTYPPAPPPAPVPTPAPPTFAAPATIKNFVTVAKTDLSYSLDLVSCGGDCSDGSDGRVNRITIRLRIECTTVGANENCPHGYPTEISFGQLIGTLGVVDTVLPYRIAVSDLHNVPVPYKFEIVEGGEAIGNFNSDRLLKTVDVATDSVRPGAPLDLYFSILLAEQPPPGPWFDDVRISVSLIDTNYYCKLGDGCSGGVFDQFGTLVIDMTAPISWAGDSCPQPCPMPAGINSRPATISVTSQTTDCERDCNYSNDYSTLVAKQCFTHGSLSPFSAAPLYLYGAIAIISDAADVVQFSQTLQFDLQQYSGEHFSPYGASVTGVQQISFDIGRHELLAGDTEYCLSFRYSVKNFADGSGASQIVTVIPLIAQRCSAIELFSGACSPDARNISASLSFADSTIDRQSDTLLSPTEGQALLFSFIGNPLANSFAFEPGLCAPFCGTNRPYDVFLTSSCAFTYESENRCPGGCGDTSCIACDGTVDGTLQFDLCNICGGDNTVCADCAGTPYGTTTVDQCGECGGDGTACADCRGIVGGYSVYDVCDVCGGDGLSCVDCAGVPRGPLRVDGCGVCGGHNETCGDCAGTPFGTRRFDEDGVCGGDGSTVADDDDGDELGDQISATHDSHPVARIIGFLALVILAAVIMAFALAAARAAAAAASRDKRVYTDGRRTAEQ